MFNEKGLIVQPEDFLPFVGAGEARYIGGVAEKYHFPLDLPEAKARTYEIYLELVPSQLEAFPGAIEFARECRRAGILVAVASSADKIKVQANLEKIGLPIKFWNAVTWGEEVKKKKPAPDIFLITAEKLNVLPDQCVVIEDAVNGIQAAHTAGMRCIAVSTTFSLEKLREADLVRDSLANIKIVDLKF